MIGRQLGPYKIEAEIGRGGMGVVYRAIQMSLNRPVALKVMTAASAVDAVALERFRREGAVVSQVAHPNVIQVLDVGSADGLHFIAMEYVDGRTISDLLKDGPFRYRDAVHVCAQVASALGVLHERGLIHRDVKPSNILLTKDRHAKLGDFGVAGLTGPEGDERLTMTRAVVGTPYYMSPEQVRGSKTLDGASDVYSLGVVLYEMLTGKHPFSEMTPTEAMVQQCSESFPPIRRFCSDIPDDLARVLEQCLEKDKSDRFPDGGALYKALERARIRIDAQELDATGSGVAPDGMVSGTGFYYVDPSQKHHHDRTARLRAVFNEVLSQALDPNKGRRKRLGQLYARCLEAKDNIRKNEKAARELSERQRYHDDKAKAARLESQRQITSGNSDSARSAVDLEAHHARIALDYDRQVKALHLQDEAAKAQYAKLKLQHSRDADDLALRDADARRLGKRIPFGGEDPGLARLARWIRSGLAFAGLVGLVVLMVCLMRINQGSRGDDDEVVAVQPPVVPDKIDKLPGPAVAAEPVRPAGRVDLDLGLLFKYSFDADEGAVIRNDVSGGLNGVNHDVRWVKDGVLGGGVYFGGKRADKRTADFIDTGVQLRPVLSLAMWFKLDKDLNIEWPELAAAHRYADDSGCFELRCGPKEDGGGNYRLQVEFVNDKFTPLKGTTTIKRDQWYHVVLIADNGRLALYLNGRLEVQRQGKILSDTYNILIGTRHYQPVECFFHGVMDEIRMYDRALTDDEVLELYAEVKPGGLVLHYTFDNDEAGMVVDMSGNERTGVRHGCRWTRDGALNGALYIASTNDYVICDDAGFPEGSGARTISLWVKLRVMSSLYVLSYGSLYAGIPPDNQWNGISLDQRVGRRQFAFSQDGGVFLSAERVEAGQWYHVAYTYRGGTEHKFYINGIESNAANELRTPLNTVLKDGFRVGGHKYGVMDGWIDDVRVYDKVLNSTEIRQLYGAYKGG